ncbi:uncharacterized protein LOC133737447 [Rosa rugosa]|uniref:uncharacterized protein LOC133737447 n=1 Tax=Rosa rugosa TaxID=74645 RepID=UPI002B414B16|nr:uncharacterized protein LOC133737447 [Rosa rugosa]
MATIMKFLYIAVLCNLIMGGNCELCSVKSLIIKQSATGKLVHGNPEWNVKIINDCACSQMSVNLDCDGFQTVEEIDPTILRKSGIQCLVNGGGPIYGHSNFSFTYAWSNSFPFRIVFSRVACA